MKTGALVGALAPLIIGMLKSGGLQKLIQGFQQKGMGVRPTRGSRPAATRR